MARVAFLQNLSVEYIGFMSMAAVLKQAGHEVRVFVDDGLRTGYFLKEIGRYRPDITGFSLLSPTEPWALATAGKIKARVNTLIVFGNVHVILNPSLIEHPDVDAVCLGEGEQPLLKLCQAIDSKSSIASIDSLWVKLDGCIHKSPVSTPQPIDSLPYLDWTIYESYSFFRHSNVIRLRLGRGCPFRCSFCTNSYLRRYYGGHKRYLTKMSPERAVAEIEFHVAHRSPRHIFFTDEVLWVENEWLRKFMQLYKEKVGLPFTANFRFGSIEEDDVRLMAEAGAERLIVATETGDENQRKTLLCKHVSNKQIFKVCGLMRKYGIKFVVSAFFGLPGDSVEGHLRQLDFYREIKPTYVWTTFFQPYPGTPLADDPSVLASLPKHKEFSATLHHDMYLDLPERKRLERLKKIYYLLVAFPGLEKFAIKLLDIVPGFIFDILFFVHFSYYVLTFENISLRQYIVHGVMLGIAPRLTWLFGVKPYDSSKGADKESDL